MSVFEHAPRNFCIFLNKIIAFSSGQYFAIVWQLALKFIQKYPLEKVRRILGREPSEAFANKTFGEFDAATAEMALTGTQRNTRYQELLAMKQMGAKIGDPAPVTWGDLIEMAPMQVPSKMIEKMQQREKAQQEQRKLQTQQQNQIQQTTMKLLDSQAQQSLGKAAETESNIAKNMTTASLNQAKTAESGSKFVKNLTAAELDESKSAGAEIDIVNRNTEQALTAAIELGKLDIERQKLLQPTQSGAT